MAVLINFVILYSIQKYIIIIIIIDLN